MTDMGKYNLLKLKAPDVIPFLLEPTVQAKVDGVPALECSYGQINGQYALRIERMISSSHESQAGNEMSEDQITDTGADDDRVAATAEHENAEKAALTLAAASRAVL